MPAFVLARAYVPTLVLVDLLDDVDFCHGSGHSLAGRLHLRDGSRRQIIEIWSEFRKTSLLGEVSNPMLERLLWD